MAKNKDKKPAADKKAAAAPSAAAGDPGVASEKANDRLQHTDELRDQAAVAAPGAPAAASEPVGSVTTRDDATDLGVPMLQGAPEEPVGPEDALGKGPTRGDYRNRLGGSDYSPHEGAEPQRPRAEEIGEVAGKKGGVDTA
jgi:hypothetical protein